MQPFVLLVDDDKFLLDMYAMKFTKEGYKVQTCLSVDEALTALRGGLQPDAILSDILMPIHDGFYFFDTIQKEKLSPKSVVIALTNQSSAEEQARAEQLGMHTYIVKATMIPSEVVQAVAQALKQKSGA
ncbi:response regulator [bacterium]|nr:response regulator [bacterium]